MTRWHPLILPRSEKISWIPEKEYQFKDWICGQNADGLGEGFERQEISTNDGVLNVHFWNSGDNYFVENEEEFNARHEFGIGGIS